MKEVSILIVDDSEPTRQIHQLFIEKLFEDSFASKPIVRLAATATEMFHFLKDEKFHLILLDWDLGKDENGKKVDGIDLIPDIIGMRPNAKIFVVTSSNDTRLAVRAMRNGALDFITKGDGQYKKEKILKALESVLEIESLHAGLTSTTTEGYICQSEAMKLVDLQLRTLSEVHTPVLILGESGLGKTHAAKRLNELSKNFHGQSQRPFLHVDINTINENLVESELFGHEKGAFTGSTQRKLGLFDLASVGDILLDEIGDASPKMQSKLLKVIEEKTFRRVGGEKDIKTNARIICATNKDLKNMVAEKKFRSDLYARICTIKISMPDLKERKEDIPYICERLAQELGDMHKKMISYSDFPPSLKQYFYRGNIPFNIRGMRSDIERLIIYCPKNSRGKIDYTKWKHILGYSSKDIKPIEDDIDLEKVDNIVYLMDRIASRLLSGKEENASLYSLKEMLEKRIFMAANDKYKKKMDIAEAIGIHKSAVSIKINKYLNRPKEQGSATPLREKEV